MIGNDEAGWGDDWRVHYTGVAFANGGDTDCCGKDTGDTEKMDEDEETAQLLFLETSPQSKRRRTLEETEVEQLVPSGDGLYETVGSSPRLADKDDSLEEEDSILFAIASPVTCSLLDATPVAPASLETDERPPVSTTTEISLGISFSALWAYLLQELTSSDLEETGNTDLKAARVKNFLRVPKELEKVCITSYVWALPISRICLYASSCFMVSSSVSIHSSTFSRFCRRVS